MAKIESVAVDKEICGIVMPISALDGCTEHHWREVQEILTDSIVSAGFEANIVSNADEIGVIQKRIVENLYSNPIVVCDVSGKNPNVMFELGMRLAFDKPTIIVKDDKTTYNFDTSPVKHLEYPRDLRYASIVEFKEKLSLKIKATIQAAKDNSNFSTFLGHFGQFKIAKLDTKEVPGQEFILEELKQLREELRANDSINRARRSYRSPYVSDFTACMKDIPKDQLPDMMRKISSLSGVANVSLEERGSDHYHLIVAAEDGVRLDLDELRELTNGRRFKGSSSLLPPRAMPRPSVTK